MFPYSSENVTADYFYKLVVRQVLHFLQVVEGCAIIQTIHVHDLVLRVLFRKQNHNMGSAG